MAGANDVLSHFAVTADTDQATNEVKKFTGGFSSLFSTIAAGTAVGGLLGTVVSGIAGALGAAASKVMQFATGSIAMNATLETTTLQFETLMGSADRAREHVAFLFEFAKKTPFETGPIINASKTLQTFGGAALNTQKNLLLFGDAAAAVQKDIGEISMWSGRLYASLQAGRPFGEAAQRLSELAVLQPKVRMELEAMQKAGKNGAEIWAKYQESIGRFSGAMEKQANTWTGLMSTLSDTVNMAAATAFAPFFEMAREGLKTITELLGSEGVTNAVKLFAATASAVFRIVGGALKPVIQLVKDLAVSFGGLTDSQQLATSAAQVLIKWLAFVTDNWGSVVGAVRMVGGAYIDLITVFGKVQVAFGEVAKFILDKSADIAEAMATITFGPLSAQYSKGAQILRGAIAEIDKSIDGARQRNKDYADTWKKIDEGLGKVETGLHTAADQMREQASTLQVTVPALAEASEGYGEAGAAADAFGEAVGKGKKSVSDFAKTVPYELAALATEWRKQPAAIQQNRESIDILIAKYTELRAKALGKHALPADLEALYVAFAKPLEAGSRFSDFLYAGLRPALVQTEQDINDVAIAAGKLRSDGTIPVAQSFSDLSGELVGFQGTAYSTREEVEQVRENLATAGEEAQKLARESLRDLATSLFQVAELFDGTDSAIGRFITTAAQVVTSINAIGDSVTAMKTGFAQMTSGGGIMSTLGGMTNMLSAGLAIAGVVGGLVKKWFGVSEEVKKARGELEKFQDKLADVATDTQRAEAGTERWKLDVITVRDAYLAVGKTAEEARADVEAMWDTDNPERSRAAIERINRALDEQKRLLERNKDAANDLYDDLIDLAKEAGDVMPAELRPMLERLRELGMLTDDQIKKLRQFGDTGALNIKKMEDALKVFNGRVDALGPAFKQAKINETAATYINALDLMIRGGADVGGVLFDAREEIAALVRDTIAAGGTLPANLKPFIDELVRSGNLIDENGDKITDVSQLKWGAAIKTEAEIMKEAFDAMADRLEALLKQITGHADDTAGSVDKVGDAVKRQDGAVYDSEGRWRKWGDTAVEQAQRVAGAVRGAHEEVDGVTYGDSPGGLKEWTPMLRGALGALSSVHDMMSFVRDEADAIGRGIPMPPLGKGVGGPHLMAGIPDESGQAPTLGKGVGGPLIGIPAKPAPKTTPTSSGPSAGIHTPNVDEAQLAELRKMNMILPTLKSRIAILVDDEVLVEGQIEELVDRKFGPLMLKKLEEGGDFARRFSKAAMPIKK